MQKTCPRKDCQAVHAKIPFVCTCIKNMFHTNNDNVKLFLMQFKYFKIRMTIAKLTILLYNAFLP